MPGAGRTDLWNSLWGFWYGGAALREGRLPWRTELLGWPDGGVLLPADPVNLILAAPLTWSVGVAAAYGLLVLGHLTFSGVAAHLLAREVQGADRAGWVAGVGWMCAPVMISAAQNGTSEALAGGWLAMAALALLRAAREERWAAMRWARAGLWLALATAASWYMGGCGWLLLAAIALVGVEGARRGDVLRRLAAAGALALVLTAPLAAVTHAAATHESNLVGIKHEKELDTVRRSTGAADPRGWFMAGDWRSPDFRETSAYGEEFIHCHYLGFTLIIGAAFTRRRRSSAALGLAGLAGFALAHGPVVVLDAGPLILDGRLAVPMPYFLVEDLPGFSSLSLVFRLGAAPALAAAVLAGGAALHGPRWVPALAAAVVVAELRLIAPTAGLPEHEPAAIASGVMALAALPEGAVMNAPLAGGRPYLYEQTSHGRPIAGTLNFPANEAAQDVWRALLDPRRPAANRARRAARVAREAHIRYLVVHDDPIHRPDRHDEAVESLRRVSPPIIAEDGVEVFDLWQAK